MSELFEANVKAFEQFDPNLAGRVRGHRPGPNVSFSSTDGKHDVSIGGTALYRGDAERYGVRHLRKFLQRPVRMTIPFPDELIPHYLHLPEFNDDFDTLRKEFIDAGPPIAVGTQVGDPYAFLCLGIGLGFHLDAILERVNVRNLFVCEPVFDLFYHSLNVFDWARFLARANERSIRVSLNFSDDAKLSARLFYKHMTQSCPAALDGTFVYRHYETDFFNQVYAVIGELIHLFATEWGCVEDEIPQLLNTAANLRQQSVWRLIESPQADGGAPAGRRKAPAGNGLTAIIAASGPSLDGRLEELAQAKGKAAIFTGGSSLLPLVKAGIRPDFHAEVERDNSIFVTFANIHREHDLDDVPLVLSTTIDPGFTKEFTNNVIFTYLRDHLCPAALLSNLIRPLRPSGPTSELICLGAALGLGMKRIIFIGNDYGSRTLDQHHAKGSFYEEDYYVPRAGADLFELYNTYTLTAPGNLGGEIHTNHQLLKLKFAAESAIANNRDVQFFNMSDGVHIEGAKPIKRLSDVLDLGADQSAKIRGLTEQARTIDAGLPVIEDQLNAARRSIETHRLSKRLRASLESGPANGWIYDLFADFLNDDDVSRLYRMMISGDINRNLFIQSILANRIPVSDMRHKFDRAFLDKFAARMEALEDRLIETIDSIIAA